MPSKPRMHIPRSTNQQPDTYSLIDEPGKNISSHHHPSSSYRPFKPQTTMRNKARLHLALYALPKSPDTYHYALLVRPKDIAATLALSGLLTATKHHVVPTVRTTPHGTLTHPYIYQTYHIPNLADEPCLLASIVVAKVSVSQERVGELLRRVPVRGDGGEDVGHKFSDVEWVRAGIEALRAADAVKGDGLGWEAVFERSLDYMQRKRAEGRWEVGWKGGNPEAVATYDLLTGRDVLF